MIIIMLEDDSMANFNLNPDSIPNGQWLIANRRIEPPGPPPPPPALHNPARFSDPMAPRDHYADEFTYRLHGQR